jgi:hypothetical protein
MSDVDGKEVYADCGDGVQLENQMSGDLFMRAACGMPGEYM